MSNLISELKEKIKIEREHSKQNWKMICFYTALQRFDVDRVNEILDSDFSMKDFEDNYGSTIDSILVGFENQLTDGFLTKGHSIDESIQIVKEYMDTEKEDLPSEVSSYLDNLTSNLLVILEKLYQKGANINLNMVIGGDDVTRESNSPLFNVLEYLDVTKSLDVVNWLLSKPELNLLVKNDNKSILESVIPLHSKDSVALLEYFLNKGIPLDEYSLADEYGLEKSLDQKLSSLHSCLLRASDKTRDDKLQILSKYATPEQLNEFQKFQEKHNEQDIRI